MTPGAPGLTTLDYARHILRCRQRRAEIMPELDVGDLCWSMLLELFIADAEAQRVPISAVCTVANVPLTTALRYLNGLCAQGKVVRAADPSDHRRILVSIAPDARAAVDAILHDSIIELYRRAQRDRR